MILAFIAAGLKVLSDSFLSGLGSGLAGLFVNKLESMGHHEIVAQLALPGQAPQAQRQAPAILVTTAKPEPNFHDQVEQTGRADTVAAPIAQTFGNAGGGRGRVLGVDLLRAARPQWAFTPKFG